MFCRICDSFVTKVLHKVRVFEDRLCRSCIRLFELDHRYLYPACERSKSRRGMWPQ